MVKPEAAARQRIDATLMASGWTVQDRKQVNLAATRGVAVREFPLKGGYGAADYLLFVDGLPVGVVEAKREGQTLSGVEVQAEKYSLGLSAHLAPPVRPLPFLYQSTGVETRFTSGLDPKPRGRRVFAFHRPETLAGWLQAPMLPGEDRPASLRGRLQHVPALHDQGLWPAQRTAVRNLETSLAHDRPRSLIQMATGSGKTFTAVTSVYRLVKHVDARRVLFLVDRANLGRQAEREFQQYVTPDDGRKFTDLYNVQFLRSNRLDPAARVVITTIQRLYSILQGEEELDLELDERSGYETLEALRREPVPVTYNAQIPIETFDAVFADECHRSIYNLWRQVLEYFDAFLVGLTATPSKQTLGFFDRNLVMEYGHEQAVADGVNVDFDVYRIRTAITEQGATVEAGVWVDKRARLTRKRRWEQLDEDLSYASTTLDRDVVAVDQIRTIVRTYRDKLFTEIFPGRREVPKTLIFAKDDSHAEDIVQIVREEFGEGNDFCEKITYKTSTARVVERVVGPDGRAEERISYKATGLRPEDLLSSFRNSYNPRVVVTVDMIATGTDVKPLEVVMFLRGVKSRTFFEQMKGRGVRVINPTDLQAVTPDAVAKTRFVIVDCVGVCESPLMDTRPLERQPSVSFEKLLDALTFGSRDPDLFSSLASRLARLERQLSIEDVKALETTARGTPLTSIVAGLVAALDPDQQVDQARRDAGLPADAVPSEAQVAAARKMLLDQAAAPLATNPALRMQLVQVKQSLEQTIDVVSEDTVLEAGYSLAAREKARETVASFKEFLEQHKDEMTALQVLYSRPYAHRLGYADIKELAAAIKAPPHAWTPEALWHAYEALDRSKVRGSGGRVLTDIVSLVRYTLEQDQALVPFPTTVEERFARWLVQQDGLGRHFTPEQRQWLELIRDHIAANLEIEADDFSYAPFVEHGGLGRVYEVLGAELTPLLEELNEVLAA